MFFGISFLFPSHQIALDVLQLPDFKIKNIYKIGESIFLPYDQDIKTIFIESRSFSHIEKYFFATAPFSQKNNFKIYGEFNNGPSVGINNFFKTPINNYFYLNLKLKQTKKPAPKLRLSTSVWKKVNNKHKKQKKKERAFIQKLYKKKSKLKSHKCWVQPIYSKIVSKFSAPRRLPNNRSYLHSGLDLRARSPQPILASAEGLILYSGSMIVPGKNILIDHGKGLFSRYMHLSEIYVKENQLIKQGQKIGLSGGTGRVEAPHLHWEILWKGSPADPLDFLKTWSLICKPSGLSVFKFTEI